jgi:hypothetical protein
LFNERVLEDMPPSLQSLIAMRLDGLGPSKRDLLRWAAGVGRTCDEDALAALLPDEARPFIGRHLEALERKQLIAATGPHSVSFMR